MFVLDSSGSIGPSNYKGVKDYAYNFTASLINNNQNSRIGVIIYSNSASVEINMSYVTPMLLQDIRNLFYMGESTNTPEGLCLLTSSSHTPWRNEISILRFAIVLTDGHSNQHSSSCVDHERPGTVDSTSARVRALDPQVIVFAIGVGNDINQTELNIIATSPALVDRLDSFDYRDLEQNQRSRAYILCYEGE